MAGAETGAFTVVVDVNVLVSAQNASRAGRVATISQRTLAYVTSGNVHGMPVQMAVSFKMIDAYRDVLLRHGYDADAIDAAAEALMDLVRHGPRVLDPYLVFGGTPDPSLRDVKDGGVLATAFAASADVLVTDNLSDFLAADCEAFNTSVGRRPDGQTRQLSCQIHTRANGRTLLVVHPVDFVHWMERRFDISPAWIRSMFAPARKPSRGS